MLVDSLDIIAAIIQLLDCIVLIALVYILTGDAKALKDACERIYKVGIQGAAERRISRRLIA